MLLSGCQTSRDCPLDERAWRGLEYLESVAGPGAIAEMIEHFGHDMPDRIQRMKAALETGDLVLLARLAHDLKSNCATLGIPVLSALGANVERVAEAGTVEKVLPLIAEIEQFLPGILAVLKLRGSSFTS